jgi:hypothetical protein
VVFTKAQPQGNAMSWPVLPGALLYSTTWSGSQLGAYTSELQVAVRDVPAGLTACVAASCSAP